MFDPLFAYFLVIAVAVCVTTATLSCARRRHFDNQEPWAYEQMDEEEWLFTLKHARDAVSHSYPR